MGRKSLDDCRPCWAMKSPVRLLGHVCTCLVQSSGTAAAQLCKHVPVLRKAKAFVLPHVAKSFLLSSPRKLVHHPKER